MGDALGIELHPDVLPFSNIPAWLPPFLLRPDRVMTEVDKPDRTRVAGPGAQREHVRRVSRQDRDGFDLDELPSVSKRRHTHQRARRRRDR